MDGRLHLGAAGLRSKSGALSRLLCAVEGRTVQDYCLRHLRVVAARQIGLDLVDQTLLHLLCSWGIRRALEAA